MIHINGLGDVMLIVLEDVMQYIRGRQRELNIKPEHLANGVGYLGYLRKASLTIQDTVSNAEKDELQRVTTIFQNNPMYTNRERCGS